MAIENFLQEALSTFFSGIDFDSDSKEKDNDFAESFLLMQCVCDKAVSFLTGENLNVES